MLPAAHSLRNEIGRKTAKLTYVIGLNPEKPEEFYRLKDFVPLSSLRARPAIPRPYTGLSG